MAATHRRAVDLRRDGQIESATWNPTTGCDRVSPGCDHCYALTFARRLQAMGNPGYRRDGDPRTSGPGFGLTLHPQRLDTPLRWRRPRLVFVDSMSDLFHPRIPDSFLAEVLDVLRRAERHTFFVLTKRPQRMASALARLQPRPLSNVWWGTTIESNDYVHRADRLRATPAAIRFLSLQPLLGPLPDLDLAGLDWVYVGGESGPGHRPMEPGWVRDIRDRCVAAGVPFLFKQWGGRTRNAGGRVLDGRTWDEMPPAGAPGRGGW
ncbi:phage Gp37/Gp68 family protein [Amycolatopsis sp. K13G38]|uniref:Phage Gp37/Gp68 family protein n=1 Tax=Amycolatopsis acididurans TaxID=2724524 RepID=A0ABX1IXI4_9PSEU|nr:phage Gp37/Gp68 family protein [Amycolatopsis acididurans]NKQ52215.1 phage Gp37/Gp68 family protein [Amycolatopsis acididurans]